MGRTAVIAVDLYHTNMASKERLQNVKNELRAIGVTSYELSKPEVAQLADQLHLGETVQAIIFGFYGSGYGILAATNERVIFIDKMIIGVKVETFVYNLLGGIEYDLGTFTGKIRLICRGETYTFKWVKKSHAKNFFNYVEDKILKVQNKGK